MGENTLCKELNYSIHSLKGVYSYIILVHANSINQPIGTIKGTTPTLICVLGEVAQSHEFNGRV